MTRASEKREAAHEHRFHIKMRVPGFCRIDGRCLIIEGAQDMFMADASALPVDIALAQAQSPPAVIQPPSTDGMRGDEALLRSFKDYMSFPGGLKNNDQGYSYEPIGPLGMPALTVRSHDDFQLVRKPSGKSVIAWRPIGLATMACLYLDVEAKQAGAWGPECTISKIFKMPQGKLVPSTDPKARPGDYIYTPTRAGSDTLRFMLDNGAGKQVDITFEIRTSIYRGGPLDPEATVATIHNGHELAALKRPVELSALLAAASAVAPTDHTGQKGKSGAT